MLQSNLRTWDAAVLENHESNGRIDKICCLWLRSLGPWLFEVGKLPAFWGVAVLNGTNISLTKNYHSITKCAMTYVCSWYWYISGRHLYTKFLLHIYIHLWCDPQASLLLKRLQVIYERNHDQLVHSLLETFVIETRDWNGVRRMDSTDIDGRHLHKLVLFHDIPDRAFESPC